MRTTKLFSEKRTSSKEPPSSNTECRSPKRPSRAHATGGRAKARPRTVSPSNHPHPDPALPAVPAAPAFQFLPDQAWVVDTPRTRAILDAFTNHANSLGIPEALQLLQEVMGDQYCEKCWAKCLDCLSAAPGEEPLATVSEVLELYSYPYQPGALGHQHPERNFEQLENRLEEFTRVQQEML